MKDLAIYIHWPFCLSKCPYCDFNSHVRDRLDPKEWQAAYIRELAFYRNLTGPRRVTSIFFGGGTPSLMSPDLVECIIKKINDLWGLDGDIEVTLEANPTSIEIDRFRGFKNAGVNRISIGIQSLNDDDLKFLGRQHSAAEGMRAIDIAGDVFDRYSFDLIYARPGQTESAWEQELTAGLKLAQGGHMSLYQLTIEPQTPFFTSHARGDFAVPGDDDAAALYTLTDQWMADAGLPAYEISNYARSGQESRHNVTYWRYGDYVGVGPGAHGRLTLNGVKYATRAHRAPELWRDRVVQNGHGTHPFTVVPLADRGVEALMMGLRLSAGLDLNRIADETGNAWQATIDLDHLAQLIASGDVSVIDETLRSTLSGRLRLNRVIEYLVRN